LRRGADIVVIVHGDNQYDPSYVPRFVEKIRVEQFHVVPCTRMVLGDALENGIPVWKFIPNRLLATLENRVFGTSISDCHSGGRAFSRKGSKRLLPKRPYRGLSPTCSTLCLPLVVDAAESEALADRWQSLH
jgi:hypothetical protein